MRSAIFTLLLLTISAAAPAATAAIAQPAGLPVEGEIIADPADVESIDAIMAAIYDVISGPGEKSRDWDRFRSLFTDGARLIAVSPAAPTGVVVMSPEEYFKRAEPFFATGFFEAEIGRKIDRYGNLVHVFSAYDGRKSLSDEKPFVRGINSFQLVFYNERWWIVSIFWQAETPDNLVPEDMLFTD